MGVELSFEQAAAAAASAAAVITRTDFQIFTIDPPLVGCVRCRWFRRERRSERADAVADELKGSNGRIFDFLAVCHRFFMVRPEDLSSEPLRATAVNERRRSVMEDS